MQRIEENNRVGKTRDLFKKIRDTKGTFHAKMGSIKDRNGMKRGGKNIENYARKIFIPSNHDGVITCPLPDILKCSQVSLRKHHYEQS